MNGFWHGPVQEYYNIGSLLSEDKNGFMEIPP
jgi:hypothetical protein